MATTRQDADDILKIFERRHADGRYYYTDKDVRHFLPMMALSSNVDFKLYPSLQKVMEELLDKLNLKPNAAPSAVAIAMNAYYAKNPVNPELLAAYKQHCRARGNG